MKTILVALLLTASLSGCATTGQQDKLITVCNSSATTMDIVTAGVRAGKINKADQDRAIAAAEALQPICNPGVKP
jgi:hypothetical protein